jgi:hypothetical protein
MRMTDELRQHEEFPEAEDPVGTRVLQQRVEQVGGREDVGEGPVRGLVGETQGRGERAEPAVGDHLADEPSRHRESVDGRVGERLPAGRHEGVVEEGEIEAQVVTDEHRAPDELEERGEHLTHPRCVGDHRVTDTGEDGDERRDPSVRTHERLVGAEQLPAAEPRRGHFGQRGRRR